MACMPTAKQRSRFALGVIFLGIAVLHRTKRDFFAKLVPARLSRYATTVDTATELVMAASGVSFLVPTLRPVARYLPTSMLVATLPAAIDQVRHPEAMREVGVPPVLTPIQRMRARAAMN